jgi:hypothetical protein
MQDKIYVEMKAAGYLIALFLLLGVIGCSGDSSTEMTDNKLVNEVPRNENAGIVGTDNKDNLNISLLLDLSDRISPEVHSNPSMEYYARDVGYIATISNAFEFHVRNKRINLIDDRIQMYFDPPPLNAEINSLAESVKRHLTRKNASREMVLNISDDYKNVAERIYQLAITDANYVGSDIWRFFKDRVEDYCIEPGYRNILIILTDGYIYHERTVMAEGNATTYITPKYLKANNFTTSKWREQIESQNFKLIPANENLNALEVLVLGINPSVGNPYEGEIIKRYWSDWLTDMGVKRFELKISDLPVNMEGVIKDFIVED